MFKYMVSEPPFAFLPWTPQISGAGPLRGKPKIRSLTCEIPQSAPASFPPLLQLPWLPRCSTALQPCSLLRFWHSLLLLGILFF